LNGKLMRKFALRSIKPQSESRITPGALRRAGEEVMATAGPWRLSAVALLTLVLTAMSTPGAAQAELQAYLIRYQQYFDSGNYTAALEEARKFEAAARASHGARHESYAGALFLQARALYVLGKYSDAENLYKSALPIFEKSAASAASIRDLAKTLNGLGRVYEHQGRYGEAEAVQKRALAAVENYAGGDQIVVSDALEDLGNAYFGEGRYAEAEEYYRRTLAIRENAPGGQYAGVPQTLNLLANVCMRTGRFSEAETQMKRALELQEKALGPTHPDVAKSSTNLAEVYRLTARYAQAEPLQRRALAIQEKALGKDHPHVGVTLNNLAATYTAWGRFADAEPLYRRSVEIQKKTLGQVHPQVATTLNNLGLVYMRLGKHADAERELKAALAIREQALPKDHPDIGQSLGNLAAAYRNAGRPADGLPLLQRAVSIMEKNYGAEHLNVSYSLTATANAYVALKRYAEAEPFAQRALAIREKILPADHTDLASVLKTLAQLNLGMGRIQPATDFSRRAVQVAVRALNSGDALSAGFDIGGLREYFDLHLAVLQRAQVQAPASREQISEAFEIGQWANQSAAAAAMNQMAVRASAGNASLASLVRRQQDDASEFRVLVKNLTAELSKRADQRDGAREESMRQRLAALQGRIDAGSGQIATDFPNYAALLNPKPLSLAETQQLLAPGEALAAFHLSDQGNYVWAVTSDRAEWHEIKLSRAEIEEKVQKLRAAADLGKLLKQQSRRDDQLFDLELAHALYTALFGPIAAALADKTHLLVVSSGALTSLPLHLLVTSPPTGSKPSWRSFAGYRSAAWLMRKYALTSLPSVSGLKVPRTARSGAPQAYLGFGNPLFGPAATPRAGQARDRSRAPANLSYRRYLREARIDTASLRDALEPLPETADEVRTTAALLHATGDAVRLSGDATEEAVKTAKLDNYRVLHFATHALVAGETARFTDLAEPALVFTLPQTPSELDDGLLMSSEVAGLKLNADWVILSACNTADGDTPGAEALSGLARAFFYAGARTLLVSHWYVDSRAALQLTTRTVQRLEEDKEMLPAQALRAAMAELVDSGKDEDAYPGIWAPFMVVGLSSR
jgi:CHAT domain-containing protein/Tfp pilus assembly protein PilF